MFNFPFADEFSVQAVHVVDCRSIRVSLTHTVKNQDWEPPRNFEKNYAKKESDRIELLNEVRLQGRGTRDLLTNI